MKPLRTTFAPESAPRMPVVNVVNRGTRKQGHQEKVKPQGFCFDGWQGHFGLVHTVIPRSKRKQLIGADQAVQKEYHKLHVVLKTWGILPSCDM